MQPVKMYATSWCGYCAAARRLFESKGVEWEEIDTEQQPEAAAAMRQQTQTTTVPQIFIGETHIGGFDEMAALERDGKLDPLLAGSA